MKNPKIIPSEPQHPRVLAEEAVSEKAQKKDVAAINKPAPMPKPTKNCRTFSEDDEDDSGRFAMNDAESWAAWDEAHKSGGKSVGGKIASHYLKDKEFVKLPSGVHVSNFDGIKFFSKGGEHDRFDPNKRGAMVTSIGGKHEVSRVNGPTTEHESHESALEAAHNYVKGR